MDLLRAGRSRYRIPVGTRYSAPVDTGPGAQLASCPIRTGSFSGLRRPGRGLSHLFLSNAEVKERVELYFPFMPHDRLKGEFHLFIYVC